MNLYQTEIFIGILATQSRNTGSFLALKFIRKVLRLRDFHIEKTFVQSRSFMAVVHRSSFQRKLKQSNFKGSIGISEKNSALKRTIT